MTILLSETAFSIELLLKVCDSLFNYQDVFELLCFCFDGFDCIWRAAQIDVNRQCSRNKRVQIENQ